MEKFNRIARKCTYYILLVSLIISFIVTAGRLLGFWNPPTTVRARSDAMLMIAQCTLAIIAIHVPHFFERKLPFNLPDAFFTLFYFFIYCSVILGEVFSFFYRVPPWDIYLHSYSGILLGTLVYGLLPSLQNRGQSALSISPLLVALIVFCFSVAAGTLWEIYEFTLDGLMKMNMQKYMSEAGEVFIGRDALADTMEDLICDVLSAVVIAFHYYRKHKKLVLAPAGSAVLATAKH